MRYIIGLGLVIILFLIFYLAKRYTDFKKPIKFLLFTVIGISLLTIFFLYQSSKELEVVRPVQLHNTIQTGMQNKTSDFAVEVSVNVEVEKEVETTTVNEIDVVQEMAPAKPIQLEPGNIALIDVAVATLWSEPNLVRSIDGASASNPVDIWTWTKSMSIGEKDGLIGKLETQALYGQTVTVLEVRNEWVQVAIPEQPTPKSEKGYNAWMPIKQLVYETTYANVKDQNPFALVTAPTAWLFNDQGQTEPFMEVSFNTRLPVVSQIDGFTLVATPSGGDKWISSESISVYQSEEDIPYPTGEKLVQTAKMFLGLPYLWAGTSGFGFDCSGFTYTLYKAHGMTIPRDSSVQAIHGTAIKRENLREGDLLFFATENGKGYVHHVGMYIGNGEMIHAPNHSQPVEIIKVFEDEFWASEYAGARRYIGE